MTDNEIIKALECCGEIDRKYCDACTYRNENDCVAALARDVLGLINRQKAEIAYYERLVHEWDDKLTRIIEGLPLKFYSLKSEAIKEFAERLKGLLSLNFRVSNIDYLDIATDIDNLVKEMVGEQERTNGVLKGAFWDLGLSDLSCVVIENGLAGTKRKELIKSG